MTRSASWQDTTAVASDRPLVVMSVRQRASANPFHSTIQWLMASTPERSYTRWYDDTTWGSLSLLSGCWWSASMAQTDG